MRIHVRADRVRLFLPIPLTAVRLAVRILPEGVFRKLRAKCPEPWTALLTKKNAVLLIRSVTGSLKGYRGLEIVRVETKDGTYISLKL